MKASRIAVLVVAVLAAGGAFMLANSPKPQPVQVEAAPPPPPADQVLVASKDVPVGTILGDSDIGWQSWPKSALAPGMIVQASDPKALDDIKGSIARASFFQGEPVRREKLIKGGAGFMSAILPSGKRAVAINIDTSGNNSAGNFILPNDRVDVVRTQQETNNGIGGTQTYVTDTVLHDIRVLAIGPNVQEKNGQSVISGQNATLELDPGQAEMVIKAQRTGQLSLTLRSILDANKQTEQANAGSGTLTVVRFGLVSADTGAK